MVLHLAKDFPLNGGGTLRFYEDDYQNKHHATVLAAQKEQNEKDGNGNGGEGSEKLAYKEVIHEVEPFFNAVTFYDISPEAFHLEYDIDMVI